MFKTLLFLCLFLSQCTKADEEDDLIQTELDRPLKYLFLFGGIFMTAILRFLVTSFELPIPYTIFPILLGIILGITALYEPSMRRVATLSHVMLLNMREIYLPAVIFSTGLCMDVHAFWKSLPQVLIISGPVFLISLSMCGYLMKLVIDPSWDQIDGMVFGIIQSAVYPLYILKYLKESNIQTKYVTVLLQGETLFTSIFVLFLFHTVQLTVTGWIVWWYQYVCAILRMVVIGVPLGYLFSSFTLFLMKFSYNEPVKLMLLTVAIVFCTHYYVSWLCFGGLVATLILAIKMGQWRTSFSKEIEQSLTDLWNMIMDILNAVIFVNIGVMTPILLMNDLYIKDYILVFVTYLVTNMARFLTFFLFSPILSRVGYGMTFQNLLICVYGGLKNPIALDLVLKLDNTYKDKRKLQLFFLHTVGAYMLMLLLNGTLLPVLLKTLGLSDLSLSRHITMNNCMKSIYEARARTIAILKMDRFLSDANWPLVNSLTAIKHPYKKTSEVVENENEDDDYFMGYKFTFCPDCEKNIPNEPTAREMKEMIKEAKFRILKFKKTVYSRLYETGMMTKESIRILHQAVEIALDSEEGIIELDGLFRLFSKENLFYKFLRNQFQSVLRTKNEDFNLPRKHWRLWCHTIVNSKIFNFVINILIALNIIFTSFCIAFHPDKYSFYYHCVISVETICFLVYFGEVLLKIFSYSWIHIFEHGVKTYFRNFLNIFHFFIMLYSFSIIPLHILMPDHHYNYYMFIIDIVFAILLLIRLLEMLKYLKYYNFFQVIPTAMLKFLDAKVSKHISLAYEIGKNYTDGEEEILDNLKQMIDNRTIRDIIKKRIESDRLAVTRSLGLVQKKSPFVATTVKTRAAINTVLNSMKEDIYELKVSGWVDDVEYEKLLKSLAERYKHLNTLQAVPPLSPNIIFREMPFMNDTIADFLYDNVAVKKFDPGDIIFNSGEIVEGIYILITGMFLVCYTPKPEILEKLKETGALPVVDFISNVNYEEPASEYLVPGNTLGELSFVSERCYDGMVVAETHSHVYVLKSSVLRKAMLRDPDPVNGLECRIWKSIAFRRAITIMINTAAYRSYTQEKLKYIIERSFIPDLSKYKIFSVNEMMEDILLIEGIVVDFNTRDIYVAPCHIPRACQKLIMPKSSLLNMEIPIETKLMIIPAKNYDPYDIMINEEKTCQLVDDEDEDTRCLQHLIRRRDSLSTKRSRRASRVLTQAIMKNVGKKISKRISIAVDDPKEVKESKVKLKKPKT